MTAWFICSPVIFIKVAEVRPLYKNDGRADKSNYRPISILSNISKIHERCLYSQLYDYFDNNIFSKYQCGFRKGFSTQHALLVMIEKVKIDRDNRILRGYSHRLIKSFRLCLSRSPHWKTKRLWIRSKCTETYL